MSLQEVDSHGNFRAIIDITSFAMTVSAIVTMATVTMAPLRRELHNHIWTGTAEYGGSQGRRQ